LVRHPLVRLVHQRILHIACGYEDQDDVDILRRDPLLKLFSGRHPHEPTADLASQPTISRLENAVDRRACYRLAQALLGMYLHARERDSRPAHLPLSVDSTDDPTRGEQKGSSYHSYFQQHRYHLLLIFDGHTNQFITAALRHGTVQASRGVVAILTRLVAAIHARKPQIAIEVHTDRGFAIPAHTTIASANGSARPLASLPTRICLRWQRRWSSGPSNCITRRARRCVCSLNAAKQPSHVPTSAASSTTPRR
jgi:hypothetical protein